MRTASQVPARFRFFLMTQREWITWQTTNIYRLINVRLASATAPPSSSFVTQPDNSTDFN